MREFRLRVAVVEFRPSRRQAPGDAGRTCPDRREELDTSAEVQDAGTWLEFEEHAPQRRVGDGTEDSREGATQTYQLLDLVFVGGRSETACFAFGEFRCLMDNQSSGGRQRQRS